MVFGNQWERKEAKDMFHLSAVALVVFYFFAMFNAFFGFLFITFLLVMIKLKLCDDNLKTRKMLFAMMLRNAKTKKEKETLNEIWG